MHPLSPQVKKKNSLKELTTWRIGGTVADLFFPNSIDEIRAIVLSCKVKKIPISVLGYGSNVLIDDSGVDGAVIVLKKNFSKYFFEESRLLVLESGMACPRLARMVWNLGFNNLAFLVGIPGSLGGAVQMNAGAHQHSIMEHVDKVELMDSDGVLHQFYRQDLEFCYRNTVFPIKGIITRVWLRLRTDGILSLNEVMDYRTKTQPLGYYSCGSVFKNPEPGISAGWLIEQVGLKGLRFGDLEISEKHANFMLNLGSAKSIDVIELTRLIQEKVYTVTGYWLHPEYKCLTYCF
jgi:UDP-N-acetylmuramate dehydrogenase